MANIVLPHDLSLDMVVELTIPPGARHAVKLV
jgi:hypothetical protein